jgi:hypothetical protein
MSEEFLKRFVCDKCVSKCGITPKEPVDSKKGCV